MSYLVHEFPAFEPATDLDPSLVDRLLNGVKNFISPPPVDWKLIVGIASMMLGTFLYDYRASLILLGCVMVIWYLVGEEE